MAKTENAHTKLSQVLGSASLSQQVSPTLSDGSQPSQPIRKTCPVDVGSDSDYPREGSGYRRESSVRRTNMSSQLDYNRRESSNRQVSKVDTTEMKAVFVDAAAMKEKVRNRLCKPVIDHYKETGWAQTIVRSSVFEQMTLAVIAFNAIWIAVDTDYNDASVLLQAHPVFQVAEHFFCVFFSFEWTVRFLAFQRKRNTLTDKWFIFDSCLVFLMVAETWVLTVVALASGNGGGSGGLGNASVLRVARLLRLTRMARMARLLRAMPELMILVKGMVAAMRSVFFTLLLLGMVMYVFGIGFTQLCEDTDIGKQYFESVGDSMYTLLIFGTLLDNVGSMATKLGKESYAFAIAFFIFILLAALTVMNMLIGVLCEVVSAVAATEREEMLVNYVNRKVRKIVEELDADGGGTISREEFAQILDNNDAIRALQDVGVDVVGLVDFADVIFEDDEELSFSKFMEVVLQLRGSNNATVKDVVDLRKLVRNEMRIMGEHLTRLNARSLEWSDTYDIVRRMDSKRVSEMEADISQQMGDIKNGRSSSKGSAYSQQEVAGPEFIKAVHSENLCYGAPVQADPVYSDLRGYEASKEALPWPIRASADTVLLKQNTSDSLQSMASQAAVPCESEMYDRYKLSHAPGGGGNGSWKPYEVTNLKGNGQWTPYEVTKLKGNGQWTPYEIANLIRPAGFQRTSWDLPGVSGAHHDRRAHQSLPILNEAAHKQMTDDSTSHPCADPVGNGNSYSVSGKGGTAEFIPAQLNAVRGQMASLGKVISTALSEVNKIQDSLSCASTTCSGCLEDTVTHRGKTLKSS